MRSRIFIASASPEVRMEIAEAVAHRLTYPPEKNKDKKVKPIVELWPFAFKSGEYTLETLLRKTQEVDYAIFILGPDDKLIGPDDKLSSIPRDNVIFELGLFMGVLGRDRCFVLVPSELSNLHILSDYKGVTFLPYESTKQLGVTALDAVQGACYEMGQQIKQQGPREFNEFRMFFGFKKQLQAVVVYPHFFAREVTKRNHKWTNDDQPFRDIQWHIREGNESQEFAHFNDLRAVSAIAEMCGRQHVNVITTRDGQEQDVLQARAMISFAIGLGNAYTWQVLEIVEKETGGRFHYDDPGNYGEYAWFEFNGTPYGKKSSQGSEGYDLRLMSWGDGSGVPTSGNKLVIVGADNHGLLHIRIFDAGGNLTDTDETKLLTTKAGAISTLKQRLPGLLPPHVLTGAEKAQVISEVTSIVDQTRSEYVDYAIIIRTFLRGGGDEAVARFVCAGGLSSGTTAAGVFLKYHWKELLGYYEQYEKDLDEHSLAVVLRYWGAKVESGKIEVERLCFFKGKDCEFHDINVYR